MIPAGFEPAIPTNQPPETHVLECAATGIGVVKFLSSNITLLFSIVLRNGVQIQTLVISKSARFTVRVFILLLAPLLFGSKRDEVTGVWRKLHNEKLHDLYSSPNIVRVIKSRRMRWGCNSNGG
jgi:hypothetical protein